MRDQKRLHMWLRRLGQLSLAVALLCATALSARADGQAEVPQPVTPKPVVTVQGNLVVDNGKPTGFYELALCVRSGRTIKAPDGTELTEAQYAQALKDIEAGTPPTGITSKDDYTITYYPFRSVAGTVNINTDVLTPVSWNLENVIYSPWDKAANSYAAQDTAPYARGIDLTATLDPTLYPDADPDDVANYIPDFTAADLTAPTAVSVRLEAVGDPQMTDMTAQVDHYVPDAANPEKNAALLTLSAATTDNRHVVFKTDTPVVVVRFAYDLNRFSGLTAVNPDYNGGGYNSITGGTSDMGFWLGADASNPTSPNKTPLTWLAKSDATNIANPYADSDKLAAATRNHQVVWYSGHCGDKAALDQETTQFYYYLGANGKQQSGVADTLVETPTDPFAVLKLTQPRTVGYKVLTPDPNGTDAEASGYTYFQNLLYYDDGSLVLKLVNAPTFRRPAGKGGTMVLFYDWDDSFLGSMLIGKGDVRAEVNEYVEKNMVHPDLRAGTILNSDLGGNLPSNLDTLTSPSGTTVPAEKYKGIIDSNDREYTYRGKYSSMVDGSGVTRPDDPDPDAKWANNDPNTPGSEYKLTNKLDYVPYRHLDTVTTLEYQNAAGSTVTERYVTSAPLSSNPDAALYPWVYCWALVEDNSARNLENWQSRRDAAKLEDVWTTIGVGELANVDPAYDLVVDNNNQAIPTTLPAGATPPATGTGITTTYPAFVDPSAVTAPTVYSYALNGESSYLRMADFSDAQALLTRNGQDTIIVKAVYEPGTALMKGNTYTAITKPAYTKWNTKAASAGGSYRVQMTVERSYVQNGQVRGTTRIRMPVVQQDTTIDYKWLSDAEKGVNNDLDNATYSASVNKMETLYTQVDADNGEEITFSLALSPRQNRVDYVLIERYGANFVVGTQRSTTNNNHKNNPPMFIPDNYNYLAGKDSDVTDDLYDCDFSTKEGSHGFVLYGTLGHFLEQATQRNRGEISQSTYESAVTYQIAPDANLRMSVSGTQPGYTSNTILREAFLKAAQKCEAHKNDPAYDCWDENLDAAKLTYHQAQWFLLDYQANPGADILTVSAAEDAAHKLSFCHYHISCSGGHVPVAPTTWKELVDKLREYNDAAAGSDDRKNARSDLDAMELAALESIASLRSNANGGKYASVTAYVDALLAADAQLKANSIPATWPSLQYALLNGVSAGTTAADMRDEAQEQYWWYAGANSAPRVNDFGGLMTAAQTARTAVTLKDGDATFLPKSALTAATFPTGAEEYLTADAPTRGQRNAWVALTDNLVPSHSEVDEDPDGTAGSGDEYTDYTYGRFTDMDDFLDKFTAQYYAIYDDVNGPTPTQPVPADNNDWWKAIQTALLPAGDNLGVHNGDESTRFWWKGGQTPFKITNLSTLLECVRRLDNMGGGDADVYMAAQKEWNRITVAEIESVAISQGLKWKGSDAKHPMYPNSAADLAADEAGQKNAIKTQLSSVVSRFDAAVAANPGLGLTWDRVQYLLLNAGALPTDNSVVNAQKNYYWWKDGNTTGTTVTLTANPVETQIDANIETLIQATYRADFGDPGVTSSILAAAKDGTFWDVTRLTTQRIQGTTFPRKGAGNDNDEYTGPDVLADVTAHAYPGASDADVTALLDVLAGFRDKAKADPGQGTKDPYGVPSFNWQEVQYFVLNGETFLDWNNQTIIDFRDKEKAVAGDYWWYYADQRVPPEPPKADAKNPEPSDPLAERIQQFLKGELADETALKNSITITQFNAMNIYQKSTGTKYAVTPAKTKTQNQNTIRSKLVTLANLVKTSPYYDAGTGTVTLYWAQIQYWWVEGVLTDNATALTHIVKDWNWSKADGSGSVKKIPDEVKLEDVPGLTAELLADDEPLDADDTATDDTAVAPDDTATPVGAHSVRPEAPDDAATPDVDNAGGQCPPLQDQTGTPTVDDAPDTPATDTPATDTPATDTPVGAHSVRPETPDDTAQGGSQTGGESPTLDDLLAQKEELERQLAALEEQIAALEAAPSTPAEEDSNDAVGADIIRPDVPNDAATPDVDDAGGQCPPLQDQTVTPTVDDTPDTPATDTPVGAHTVRPETPNDAATPDVDNAGGQCPPLQDQTGTEDPAHPETPEIPLGDEVQTGRVILSGLPERRFWLAPPPEGRKFGWLT